MVKIVAKGDRNDHPVSTIVREEDANMIDQICYDTGMTRSTVIRRMLRYVLWAAPSSVLSEATSPLMDKPGELSKLYRNRGSE